MDLELSNQALELTRSSIIARNKSMLGEEYIPHKIQIITKTGPAVYSVRSGYHKVKVICGKFGLGLPDLGVNLQMGLYQKYNYVKLVDMRPFVKEKGFIINSADLYPFYIYTSVLCKPQDARYIAINEDRIDGYVSRVVEKHLMGLSRDITINQGWWLGNVVLEKARIEKGISEDLQRYGVSLEDIYTLIFCHPSIMQVNLAQYNLGKIYKILDDFFKSPYATRLEIEKEIKIALMKQMENIIRSGGKFYGVDVLSHMQGRLENIINLDDTTLSKITDIFPEPIKMPLKKVLNFISTDLNNGSIRKSIVDKLGVDIIPNSGLKQG